VGWLAHSNIWGGWPIPSEIERHESIVQGQGLSVEALGRRACKQLNIRGKVHRLGTMGLSRQPSPLDK
jgi:hypothetical protein